MIENLRSHALRRRGQIKRLHAAAVRSLRAAVLRKEIRIRINGLHVHGLPDGSALDIFIGKHIHHLIRRDAAGGINGDAGKPVVRVSVRVHRIHGDGGDIRKGFLILSVNLLFFPFVLFNMKKLSSAHSGRYIGHTIVEAQLGMLIIAGGIPRLGGKESCLIHIFLICGNQHAAAGGGDDLVSVERIDSNVSEAARHFPLEGGAKRLCRILDEHNPSSVTDFPDPSDLGGRAVQVGADHSLRIRILFKGRLQRIRVHVPGLLLRIDEYRHRLLIADGITGGGKGQIGRKHHIPRLNPDEPQGQMDGRRSGAQRRRITASRIFGHFLLKSVHIRPERCDPVGLKGFVHKPLLIPVHGGGRQINSLFSHVLFSISVRLFLTKQVCGCRADTNPADSIAPEARSSR